MRMHALHDQIALGVLAVAAQRIELHFRIQLGQIDDDVAHRAAGGAGDAVLNMDQLSLLRPADRGIKDIYNHISGDTNALAHSFHLCVEY